MQNVSRRAVISLGKVILAQKSGCPVLREHQLRSQGVARACVWSLWEAGDVWRALLSQHRLILQEMCAPDCRISYLLQVQPPSQLLPQIIIDHPWWSAECHGSDSCSVQSFSSAWMAPFWAFPEKPHGRRRGLFSVEKYRYPLLASTLAFPGDEQIPRELGLLVNPHLH